MNEDPTFHHRREEKDFVLCMHVGSIALFCYAKHCVHSAIVY